MSFRKIVMLLYVLAGLCEGRRLVSVTQVTPAENENALETTDQPPDACCSTPTACNVYTFTKKLNLYKSKSTKGDKWKGHVPTNVELIPIEEVSDDKEVWLHLRVQAKGVSYAGWTLLAEANGEYEKREKIHCKTDCKGNGNEKSCSDASMWSVIGHASTSNVTLIQRDIPFVIPKTATSLKGIAISPLVMQMQQLTSLAIDISGPEKTINKHVAAIQGKSYSLTKGIRHHVFIYKAYDEIVKTVRMLAFTGGFPTKSISFLGTLDFLKNLPRAPNTLLNKLDDIHKKMNQVFLEGLSNEKPEDLTKIFDKLTDPKFEGLCPLMLKEKEKIPDIKQQIIAACPPDTGPHSRIEDDFDKVVEVFEKDMEAVKESSLFQSDESFDADSFQAMSTSLSSATSSLIQGSDSTSTGAPPIIQFCLLLILGACLASFLFR